MTDLELVDAVMKAEFLKPEEQVRADSAASKKANGFELNQEEKAGLYLILAERGIDSERTLD